MVRPPGGKTMPQYRISRVHTTVRAKKPQCDFYVRSIKRVILPLDSFSVLWTFFLLRENNVRKGKKILHTGNKWTPVQKGKTAK